jgi:2-oxopent-4-enoate/cis-2-oxohex-4-enoate hydratase
MMTPEKINQYGNALYDALASSTAIEPFTTTEPDMTIDDAYAIQVVMMQKRLAVTGEKMLGKKIGITSQAVMNMLKVNQPDYGQLTTGMYVTSGGAIDAKKLIAPKAEGELAFVLKHDLMGPGITNADVLRATEYVIPCIEIVDSRIRDWKIKIQDTVADNGSSGYFVLGESTIDPRDIDLTLVGMTLEKNGEVAVTGAGAAALGNPVNAVAWLANELGRRGIALHAGEVILSGALAAMVPVKAGDGIVASFGGIGSVSVRFI